MAAVVPEDPLTRKVVLHHVGTKRVVRWILRRRPCKVLLILSIAVVLFFLPGLSIISAVNRIYAYNNYMYGMEKMFAVEKMDRSKGVLHEEFCVYEHEAVSNTEYCNGTCGSQSYVFRTFSLSRNVTNPILCNTRLETNPCYESIEGGCIMYNNTSIKKKPSVVCPNHKKPVWEDYVNNEQPETPLVPAVSNEDLKSLMGTVVLAHQLLVHCPICTKRFQPFRLTEDGDCMVKLHKSKNGFPEEYNTCGGATFDHTDATRGRGKYKNRHNLCVMVE